MFGRVGFGDVGFSACVVCGGYEVLGERVCGGLGRWWKVG